MKINRNRKTTKDDKDASSSAKVVTGIGLGTIGGKLIKDSNKEGEITGRQTLYHGTTKSKAKSIKENGFDSSRSKSTDALIKSDRNQVYLSKDKSLANRTGYGRELRGEGKAETVKVSLPYEELKKKQDFKNPEYGNSTSYEEYSKKAGENKASKKVYNKMSGNKGSDTVIIGGDISNKYIKGSKNYKKNSLREISKYAKENPKRFIKGTGKLAAGTASVVGGMKLAKDTKDSKAKDALIGTAAIGAGVYTSKKSLDKNKDKLDFIEDKSKELKRKANQKEIEGDMVQKIIKNEKKTVRDAYKEVKEKEPFIKENSKKALKRVDNIVKNSKRKIKFKSAGKGIAVAAGGYAVGKKLLKNKNGSKNK